MSSLLDFFIKLGKLKTNKRKGWVLYGIKDPAATADHIFRGAILGWVLNSINKNNKKKGFNDARIIKSILIHHLPDIYIGEETPYDSLLPKDIASEISKKDQDIIREILKKLPQVSAGLERKRAIQRQQLEEKTFHRIVAKLPNEIKKDLEDLWSELNKRRTNLSKFAWESAKLESYLQSLEYWRKEGKVQHKLWNRWVKKNLKESFIIKFRKEIDKYLINNHKKCEKDALCELLRFLNEVGRLKSLKRTGWVLRRVKKPESVAQHTFQMTIMSWVLGKIKGLDTDRIVKIALVHDLCEVYAGDQTPYDPILVADKEVVRKLVEKAPRVPKAQRIEWLFKKREKEWKAIVELTSNLPKILQKEMISLWLDCEEGLTKEGRFVSQVDKLVNLFQAIEYWKKDNNFPIESWWVFIKERVDDPLLLKFTDELDKEFAIANRISSKNKNKRAGKAKSPKEK
ncbi:HD domain-containing protein [Patescibacteria group bacterium]|nr:HD domain-containing protein [Patescibacteria group bacterium]